MNERIEEGSVLPGLAAPAPCPCRWLIALDYDGTLRCPEGAPVAPSFYALMHRWRPFGVRWGINTGRNLPYLCADLLPDAPFLPDFICTTERYAYLSDAHGVLRPAAAFNRESCEANQRLKETLAPRLAQEMDRISAREPALEWNFDPRDPLSVQAADAATMDIIAPLLQPFVEALPGVAMQRAGRFMRLSDARFHKGTALCYVMERLRVPQDNLFAMGDGHNDLDAFRHFPRAYYGCPADAHPEVREWMQHHGGHVSDSTGVEALLQVWFRERVESRMAEGL